jgi:hypothetical protein
MRAISGLWRWRHNPLRRATDLVEAWLALWTLLLITVVAPLIGSLVGAGAQDVLQRSVRAQQQSRHRVTATVVRTLQDAMPAPGTESSTGGNLQSRVLAEWTAPDGTRQRGPVMADLISPSQGDHFTLWTDAHGRTVPRPPNATTAATHAVLAGFGAAMLTAGLAEGCRRVIVWRMVRRRYARWDQAWDRAGPDWGKAGTGI